MISIYKMKEYDCIIGLILGDKLDKEEQYSLFLSNKIQLTDKDIHIAFAYVVIREILNKYYF